MRCLLCLIFAALAAEPAPLAAVELGMGFRVGEVTQDSAVVWARVTAGKERVWDGTPPRRGNDDGVAVDSLEGAMPGAAGELRVTYALADDPSRKRQTEWIGVNGDTDFVHQFQLRDLQPGTEYSLTVEARGVDGEQPEATSNGTFHTPAGKESWQDVSFAVVTGQMYKDLDHREGFHIYPAMQRLDLDFLVPTGDTVYYDNDPPLANSVALCRYHWQRMYSLPRHIEFHRHVPGYWEVDDHDSYDNDCWPAKKSKLMQPLTFEQGFGVYREQVPLGENLTHRTIRWGQGLQVWLVEGRLHRSPNNAPDGPDKSIWGKEQRDWLMQSILDSDAEFKVLVSPTPIVGPDRGNKRDNHANEAFAYEGNLFRNWTAENNLKNFYVCCGDRHWQYVSIDPATKLHEFSCGPASDQHAAGSPGRDPEVQPFHRMKGGFLTVNVFRENDRPRIAFRHHGVHGDVVNEFVSSGR